MAQNAARDAAVAPAAAQTPVEKAPLAVRFAQQEARVGDRVVQRIGVHLGLTTKITQSGQVAHESTNEMRRQQQRTVEVLAAADGRASKTRASFQVSRRQAPDSPDPNALTAQPIEGKTYLMERDGDRLTITDPQGAIPPLEEYKLVAESLENVGKANPLAELLVARRLTIGERILVPRELVQPLLGFDDPLGTVRRFELTLARLDEPETDRPARCAAFQTSIDVAPSDDSPLEISLRGEMLIETDTCRVSSVDLAGPVQLSSIERTPGGIFQFSAGGDLKLAIRSQYDRVAP
jgi:hypothetical protein